MIRERTLSFFKRDQTIYWIVCLSLFALSVHFLPMLPLIFGRKIIINEHTLPGLVIAFSFTVTAIWSYWFLLLPIHDMRKTLFHEMPACKLVFFSLFYFSIGVSLFLLYVYCVALAEALPHLGTPPVSAANAVRQAFADSIPNIGSLLNDYHLLLFVGLYSAMDAIVAFACENGKQKRQFFDVLIFIDIPIFLTMIFILFVLKPRLGENFYFFEAGVVSFQLIAGSLSAIGFAVLEDSIGEIGGAAPGAFVEKL
jgi:hypothetical protein